MSSRPGHGDRVRERGRHVLHVLPARPAMRRSASITLRGGSGLFAPIADPTATQPVTTRNTTTGKHDPGRR